METLIELFIVSCVRVLFSMILVNIGMHCFTVSFGMVGKLIKINLNDGSYKLLIAKKVQLVSIFL